MYLCSVSDQYCDIRTQWGSTRGQVPPVGKGRLGLANRWRFFSPMIYTPLRLTYSFYIGEYLHFRYLKCLVKDIMVWNGLGNIFITAYHGHDVRYRPCPTKTKYKLPTKNKTHITTARTQQQTTMSKFHAKVPKT